MTKIEKLFYNFHIGQAKEAYKDGLHCVIVYNDDSTAEFGSFKVFKQELKYAIEINDLLAIRYIDPTEGSKQPAITVYQRRWKENTSVYDEYE